MRSLFLISLIAIQVVSCGSTDAETPTPKSNSFSLAAEAAHVVSPEVIPKAQYLIGAGVHDITGPIAGLATMGYGSPTPKGSGLHQRLRTRAFVITDTTESANTIAHATLDLAFITTPIKVGVVAELEKRFGGVFNDANVMLTATHTHSAPGGIDNHFFYNIPSRGYSKDNVDAIVKGTVEAIAKAYKNQEPGNIKIARGELHNTSVNRSVEAYKANPSDERERYKHDTDKSSTLLKFESAIGQEIGLIHWFAVHATAMDKENSLISGDNKGYAAWAFEKNKANNYKDDKAFVAAFGNTNAGDASPNIDKDVDGDGDWDCKALDNFICGKESGHKHVENAQELYDNASELLSGPISYRLKYYDYSKIDVAPEFTVDGQPAHTCDAALGQAFIAGSEEDGPGVGIEGVNCEERGMGNLFSFMISRIFCSVELDPCHGEKVVIVPSGKFDRPLTSQIIPNQLFVIGNLAIAGLPAEITTMAGRRLKDTVKKALEPLGVTDVISAGYANDYTGYITTYEEYQMQNYEGGHNTFGPHTLEANQQSFVELAQSITNNSELTPGAKPLEDLLTSMSAKLEGGNDRAGMGSKFGKVLTQPKKSYTKGDTLRVKIVSSNPNNNLRHQSSYYEIIKANPVGKWEVVANDSDWNTRFYWDKQMFGKSTATIHWEIPKNAETGTYKIVFKGSAKSSSGLKEYAGETKIFKIK